MSLEIKETEVRSKNWRDKRSSTCQFLLWWCSKGKCSICASGEILSLCFIFKPDSHLLLHILPSIDALFTFLSSHCASLHCFILPLLCVSHSFKITPLSFALSLLSLANSQCFDSFKEPFLQVVQHHVPDLQCVDGRLVVYANHVTVCPHVCPSILLYVAGTDALLRLAFELNSLSVATARCNPFSSGAFRCCAKEMKSRGSICSCIEGRVCLYSTWNQMSCIIKPSSRPCSGPIG